MPVKKVIVESKMGEGFKIETQIRDHKMIIDQVKAGGGNDEGPSPLEYQYMALAGCIGSIGRIVASQKRLPVKGMNIKVEGELNTDVLLGKGNGDRAGFKGMKIIVDVDADMTKEEKEAFIQEVDSRCPISDNVMNPTPVEIEVL